MMACRAVGGCPSQFWLKAVILQEIECITTSRYDPGKPVRKEARVIHKPSYNTAIIRTFRFVCWASVILPRRITSDMVAG